MSVITHNLMASFASRQLNVTSDNKAKSAEKVSTGFRINRSADDAAGLQISEKLRWQARGLNKGSANAQDGSSLLQVADGALAEVHEMLQRVNELSVQAANDTNTLQDRQAIQAEINEIMKAIDDIGENTEYNTQKIFQGGIQEVVGEDGNPIDVSNIPVSALELGSASLQENPFMSGSDAGYLNLSVSTREADPNDPVTSSNPTSPISWGLIYGNGGTSHSTIRYTDNATSVTSTIDLENMTVTGYSQAGNSYTRTLSYTDANNITLTVDQTININNSGTDAKYYEMSYSVTSSADVNIDFMFNADTAYNNNDRCEGYYIEDDNGNGKLQSFCVYTDTAYTGTEYTGQGSSYVKDIATLEPSLSIIDEDSALSFSEKIVWDKAADGGPDTVSLGNWGSDTGDWSYYDNLDTMLGGSTQDRDLAFSLMWNNRSMTANNPMEFSFDYGICSTSADTNLANVTITPAQATAIRTDTLNLWIQSGAVKDSGMFISIGEVSTGGLGLRGISVESFDDASDAINKVNDAISKISKQRSSIGAQQNRLEYTMRLDDNTAENTQAAESRLRDTDMATEMVELSKHGILEQAGQSMLSQANQNPQRVLSLLQQ